MKGERCPAESGTLEISHFSSNLHPADSCEGKITHCSGKEVGFLSSKSFPKDSAVFIRFKPDNETVVRCVMPEGLKFAALARVKWSKPIDSERGSLYETGVQYVL